MAEGKGHHDEKPHGGGSHGHGGGGGHGGAHEEHEGAPEWLISFADNVALLMGFFVILLAMNMQKPKTGGLGGEGKYPSETETQMMEWVIGLRKAFNNPVDINSSDPREQALVRYLRWKKTSEVGGESRQPADSGEAAEAQAIRDTDFSNMGGTLPFDNNSIVLNARARAIAAEIADRTRDTRWVIEIRGYASPSETMRDWDKAANISFDRAKAAAAHLIDAGLRPEQLRVIAMGDADRKVARTFDRALDAPNQRVDVVVTKDTIAAQDRARPAQTEGVPPAGDDWTPETGAPGARYARPGSAGSSGGGGHGAAPAKKEPAKSGGGH